MAFRGTVPRLLSDDFAKVYGGATHRLDDCYRCSQEALDSGETTPHRNAAPNVRGVPCTRQPLRARRPCHRAWRGTAVDEAFFCAREIKRMHAESQIFG